MRILYFFLAVAAALLVSFFFLNTYIYEEKQVDTSTNTQEEIHTPTLTDKTWVWTETLYNDERRITPRESGAFTITFAEDGNFSLATDCNSGFGSYVADGDRLTFGAVGLTKKFCQGAQEQEFIGMLEHVSGYHFGPDKHLILDLKFDSGSVVFN